jgi:hypothetical protein
VDDLIIIRAPDCNFQYSITRGNIFYLYPLENSPFLRDKIITIVFTPRDEDRKPVFFKQISNVCFCYITFLFCYSHTNCSS